MQRIQSFLPRDREFLILLITAFLVFVWLLAAVGTPFFAIDNLQSMAVQISEFGLLALAMGLSMLTGGIDLSITANAALAGIVGASVMSGRVIPVTPTNGILLMLAGIGAALVTSTACGLLNGFLVAKVSVPPILATLGTMILFTGISTAITNGQSVSVVVTEFAGLSDLAVANVPVIFLILAAALVVVGFVLNRTRFGRRIYLFGENEVALRFSGGRTERVVLSTYVLIGILVGVAAIIMTSRVNSARVGFGDSYLLQSILVVVLAGFNPYGGRGRVTSLCLSLLLLQLLSSAFNILLFSPYAKNLVWGALLIVVMAVNVLARRSRRSRVVEVPSDTESVSIALATERSQGMV